MKHVTLVLGLFLVFRGAQSLADGPSVEDRLKSLETKQQDLSDSLAMQGKPVERLFSDQFRLGGYFVMDGESLYQPQDGRSYASFTQAEFRPFVLVQFTNNWSGLAEFAVIAASDLENQDTAQRKFGPVQSFSEFDRAYIDYTGLSGLRLRFGDFFTPFGYTNIEHSESLLITADQPLHVVDNLFPSNVGGVSLFSEQLYPLNWEIYGGSEINTDFGEANISGPTAGGRVTYTLPWKREWILGANYQYFKDPITLDNVSAYGIDLRVDWNIFSLLLETEATNHNGFGMYAVPAVRFGQWLFFYAFDSIQNDLSSYDTLGTTVATPVDPQIQQFVGFNYLVTGHLRLKAQIGWISYRNDIDSSGSNKDYMAVDTQMGFSF